MENLEQLKEAMVEGDTDASVAAQFEYMIRGGNPDREDVKFSSVERLGVQPVPAERSCSRYSGK